MKLLFCLADTLPGLRLYYGTRETSGPAMPSFTVFGDVIRTISGDLGVRVENVADLREFWSEHQIDTKFHWLDSGAPVVSIGRADDVAACHPGYRVSLTFGVVDRANGKRGIRTTDFVVLARRT